jgi:hypothetical protein
MEQLNEEYKIAAKRHGVDFPSNRKFEMNVECPPHPKERVMSFRGSAKSNLETDLDLN